DRLLVRQVLEEVRKEYAVEIIPREVGVHDVRDDHLHPGGLKVALPDEVDAPALGRGHRCDELAAARGRIQDTARRAHPAVQVARDLLPHCLPAGLIDVAEPVLVQPLIVHANGHSYSRSWFMPTAKGVTTDMLPGTPFLIVGTIQTFLRRNHRGVKELI